MNKNESDSNKKSILMMVLEDAGHFFMVFLRTFVFVAAVTILFVPAGWILLNAFSVLYAPFHGLKGDIITFLLFFGLIFFFCYLRRNSTNRVAEWIQTGHIEIDISDENNQRMRYLWLKTRRGKERTKNITWKLSLNNKTDFYTLQTIYPTDKYGHQEITKDPICFRTLVPVTHKFFGNLPVKGDTINFTWTTTSNNDIKCLRVKAVEYMEKNENIPESKAFWKEIDEKSMEGTICAEGIKTGQKTKIEGSIKLSDKVTEKIQLCFWYLPQDAEGESVFRDKF